MDVDPSARTEAGAGSGAAHDLTPGGTVGKYRLERKLGAGGMGVVWAAFDPDLERPVAIKLLRSVDSVATLRTRLLREARAMARLKHPNVLTVYDVGTDRNRDYIAMELIDGADLDGWLATKPPRDQIYAALLAAGRGLAAAHTAGLIHRDLKPHNILRGNDGGVYVTDFGLARGQIEDGAELVQTPIAVAATAIASGSHPRGIDSVLDSPLTQTGVLIGTPAYMAPEQFAGRAPDPRSDQFAFCVTAWEALTGARPFVGKTLEDLRVAASAGAPGGGELPPKLRGVLARGLAPHPAERWGDMQELLRALEAAIAPEPIASAAPVARQAPAAPAAPAAPVRRARRWILAGGVVVSLALIAAGGTLLGRSRGGAAADDDCDSPSRAFGDAWSMTRQKAVASRGRGRGVQAMGVFGMLASLRGDWLRDYQAACKLPADSMEREAWLDCLRDVRDDVRDTADEMMQEQGELAIGNVVGLTVALSMCKQHAGD